MKEPLVDLEFTHDDRLRLLACVCSGHVFRKKVSYTRNVVVALDIFSDPAWYGVEQFGAWRRKRGSLLGKMREFLLRWKFHLLWTDLEVWLKSILDDELPELPKFIESTEEAAEIAAVHSTPSVDVMPSCASMAGIRDQCLRRGLRHRLSILRAEASLDTHHSEEIFESSHENEDPEPVGEPPKGTFNPETGAHTVSVTPETMSKMNTLFKQVKGDA